jgi:hypothetical protein
MKKVWEKPELEVLMVNMTMHNVKVLDHIDATYVDGTKTSDLRYS